MLYPIDANKHKKYFDMFRWQVINNKMLYLLRNEVAYFPGLERKLNEDEADQLIESMKSRAVFQITKGRGCVVSPHFSGKREGGGLLITDFITHIPKKENYFKSIQNDVHLAAISMLYGRESFPWVRVPIDISPLDLSGEDVEKTPDGLIFRRKES